MRWENLPESDQVEDRRGQGGGGFGFPIGGGGGIGLGTLIVLGLISWALGIDPRILIGGAEILTGGDSSNQQPADPRSAGVPDDDMGKFLARVLGSADAQWKVIFDKAGQRYERARLVMYTGGTRSGCGTAQSAMGPFYCPEDHKVYLDTVFFKEVETRFRGCSTNESCRFVQAYIVAHEIGHHVQNLLGILPRVQRMQDSMSKAQANHVQVQVELQADCFSGIWAKNSDEKWKLIQPGDVEAAMRTAAAIGDDTMQKKMQGRVMPDSFTHGTSEQRQRWFMIGLKEGTIAACNTFNAPSL